jgi:hypothetical protein
MDFGSRSVIWNATSSITLLTWFSFNLSSKFISCKANSWFFSLFYFFWTVNFATNWSRFPPQFLFSADNFSQVVSCHKSKQKCHKSLKGCPGKSHFRFLYCCWELGRPAAGWPPTPARARSFLSPQQLSCHQKFGSFIVWIIWAGQ